VADSFRGLPKPNLKRYPFPETSNLHNADFLAVSLEEVKQNFARYGLLDNQVKFLKGWFQDTLPKAPMKRLSLLRLDADFYESTMDILVNLYPKLSSGGFLIVDDYGSLPNCRQAVSDFRKNHNIKDKIIPVDWTGVYWRRS
jgi:hypothetical protein